MTRLAAYSTVACLYTSIHCIKRTFTGNNRLLCWSHGCESSKYESNCCYYWRQKVFTTLFM